MRAGFRFDRTTLSGGAVAVVLAFANFGLATAAPTAATAQKRATPVAAPSKSATSATQKAPPKADPKPTAKGSASQAALPPLAPAVTPQNEKVAPAKKKTASFRPPPVSARYQGAVKSWHGVAPGTEAKKDAHGRPMLTLSALNTAEEVSLTPSTDEGAFSARELDRAAHVLREPSSGNQHPVDPRELDILYAIQRHFEAPMIRVISGYRTPHGGHSNHGRGRAVDIVVPGASDEEVAKFARQLGFVGVGIYPSSGFVHVDVRERSYFWVDSSGPGRRNRERGILGDLATECDKNAYARGVRPAKPLVCAAHVEPTAPELPPGEMPANTSDEDDDVDGDG